MQYELTTPCTAADLAPLKAGDTVLLSGVVYTARDQAHKRMLEALDKGEKLPSQCWMMLKKLRCVGILSEWLSYAMIKNIA